MTERWSVNRVEKYARLGYSANRIAQLIARPYGIAWGAKNYGDLRTNRQPEVAHPETGGRGPQGTKPTPRGHATSDDGNQ